MLIDTPEKMKKRQDEFDKEELARLKRRGEMGRIIAQAKFGVDVDYSGADAGEGPKQ